MQADPEPKLERKLSELRKILHDCESVVIGYSGGVDSAYLACAALETLGPERVLAVTGRSASYPEVQYRLAMRVVRRIGLPHLELDTGELDDPNYTANPTDRCYFCKHDLYGRLLRVARERGYRTVVDGSNGDDRSDHRPGAVAAREMGVRSPLQEAGLTKAEIRELSRRHDLPTWDQPAAPCLASRIAYGVRVTRERLGRIEDAEARLRELREWGALRVRHHRGLARLEVGPEDVVALAEPALRAGVIDALREAGYERAALDLEGYRRGALNEGAGRPDLAGGAAAQTAGARGGGAVGGRAVGAHAGRAGAAAEADLDEIAEDGIALLRPRQAEALGRLLRSRASHVARCRAAGFHYVAVELFRTDVSLG